MLWQVLLYAFLIYLLYKFIFELVIPVYKTTRHLKKGFQEMNTRMNDHIKNQRQEFDTQNKTKSSPRQHSEDYIEFEEIK